MTAYPRYRPRYRRKTDARNTAAGLVVAVIAAGALSHPHAVTGTVHRAGASLTSVRAAGGTLDCAQLEALWRSAGGSARAAFMAAEIAEAESGGRQYASNTNANGTTDRGFWQVNSVHGALSTFDAYGNARAAVQISSDGGNWTPWSTYVSGAYAGRC